MAEAAGSGSEGATLPATLPHVTASGWGIRLDDVVAQYPEELNYRPGGGAGAEHDSDLAMAMQLQAELDAEAAAEGRARREAMEVFIHSFILSPLW
eukprot:CAMPEP_0179927236 /NCGR_PEP_ID=MMETSP0983-20121128/8220_1 /TAXON_ID=483367 /ORGANISM="non described non described, Strain CCMP 2436" /LENGTH=95 /DNA_ID=CAMNT_0021830947 /DNA_START=520 /DNA_END=804 /DNA_ORIENTATION=+